MAPTGTPSGPRTGAGERPELRLIGKLRRVYVRWLDRVLSHRVDTVIIVLLSILAITLTAALE